MPDPDQIPVLGVEEDPVFGDPVTDISTGGNKYTQAAFGDPVTDISIGSNEYVADRASAAVPSPNQPAPPASLKPEDIRFLAMEGGGAKGSPTLAR
jgi:hypothetical protein